MANRKNHNSVIFLATLGVYFGLVLIGGATPQIYAQAATTRNFELKDEVEVKDDLDNNPSTSCEDGLNFDVTAAVAEFFSELQILQSQPGYDAKSEANFFQRRISSASTANNLHKTRYEDNKTDKLAARVLKSLDNDDLWDLADVVQPSDSEIPGKQISLEFYPFISGLKLLISVEKESPRKALELADSLTIRFAARSNRTDDHVIKQIYESTFVLAQNNQVLIVTRLPRAGLDSLLAKDAK